MFCLIMLIKSNYPLELIDMYLLGIQIPKRGINYTTLPPRECLSQNMLPSMKTPISTPVNPNKVTYFSLTYRIFPHIKENDNIPLILESHVVHIDETRSDKGAHVKDVMMTDPS